MKKIVTYLILGITVLGYSQEVTPDDALRYSIEDLNGSARFRGMSGAFGALGGDLSALNINPAGSTVFNYNTFEGSLANYYNRNNSTYFGGRGSSNENSFDINQIGVAFVFNNTVENSDWSKLALAFNYEKTNNFDNQLFMQGTNPSNSIGNYFLNYAQGYNLEFLQTLPGESINSLYTFLGETNGLGFGAQQAMLGYQGFIFNADDDTNPSNNTYNTNIAPGSFYQDNYVNTQGYNSKATANFSGLYKNVLSLGMNLNIHFSDFLRSSSVLETNNNPEYTTGETVKLIQFDNELYSYGRGFSMNFGAILKASDMFRFGLAYESPTWYTISDELTQNLRTVTTDGINNFTNIVNPQVTNVYKSHGVTSPGKWTASTAVIFGKKGLLSFDIASKNYSNTKFRRENEDLNPYFENNFQNTISYNLGGEYRIKQISLRAGYRYEQSPYKVDYIMGDLTGYSGGIGYSFNESRVDFALSKANRNYNTQLISSGMNDAARIRNNNTNITMSYTVSF